MDGIDDDTLNLSSNDPNFDDDELDLGCKDVGVQLVRVWVRAQTGAHDYCDVLLEVQNNMGGCPESGSGTVVMDPSQIEGVGQHELSRDGFALYQNTPNPFGEQTSISFRLPSASAAQITIYDVTGKVIQVIEGDYARGLNRVEVNKDDLPQTGVLYYQLDTEAYTATKKMVVIE